VQVVNLDALTYSGSLENLRDLPDESRYSFIHGDICDADLVNRVIAEHEIDTIVHFAAESHVDRSILGPGQFIQTNIVGTFTLLEAAKTNWSAGKGLTSGTYRFHHISTDEVLWHPGAGRTRLDGGDPVRTQLAFIRLPRQLPTTWCGHTVTLTGCPSP